MKFQQIKGCFITRLQLIITICLVLVMVTVVAVLAALFGPGRCTKQQAQNSEASRKLDCEVAILGGGVTGLHMAYMLFKHNKEKDVCIFEREKRLGGRILDHQFFSVPKAIFSLGAQRFNANWHSNVRHLMNQLNVTYQPWKVTTGPVQARGFISRNRTKLKLMAYPTLTSNPLTNGSYSEIRKSLYIFERLKHWKEFPTIGSYISHYFSLEGNQYLKDMFAYPSHLSHEIQVQSILDKVIVNYLVNRSSQYARPVQGMSVLVDALIKYCESNGARIYSNNEVTQLSEGDDGQYFITTSTGKSITARKVVITIPPQPFKLVKGSTAKTIQNAPEFRGLGELPVFRAGAAYSKAWWEESEIDGVKLGNLSRYFSNGLCIKLLPYKARGPNGEAVLQLIYTNSMECTEYWKNLQDLGQEAIKKEIKRGLQILFPGVQIPEPLEIVYKYWPIISHIISIGVTNISFYDVQSWAKRPIPGRTVFMAGEAYAPFLQGWVEAALISARVILQEGWDIKMPRNTKDIIDKGEKEFAKWKQV